MFGIETAASFDSGTILLGGWAGISAAVVLLMAVCQKACSFKCCIFKRGCDKSDD